MKVIILAGGSGTRLWPLSREKYPKQFIKLHKDKESLLQETFKRSLLLAEPNDIYVVTNKDYKFLVMREIEKLGYSYPEDNIIEEPEAKNTLPAIFAGVHNISKSSDDFVVVFPSDHMIFDGFEFAKIIKASEELARDSIITFGIKPTKPNTEYGYISTGDIRLNGYKVGEFKEKPDYKTAIKYVENGYYWNAGIFMFNTGLFINEVQQYAYDIYVAFKTSNTIEEAFGKIDKKVSIDYGILEKSQKVAVVPVNVGWNDLGSFDSVYEISEKDENNNVTDKSNILIDSTDNLIYSENDKIVSTIGINDLIIIDKPDALLICKKEQSQQIKRIVETLGSRKDKRKQYHTKKHNPWGELTILDKKTNSFAVKKIKVIRNKKLEDQVHNNKREHWIIVNGIAKITIENDEKYISAGESVLINPCKKYSIENVGEVLLEIIKVDIEENDI